MTTNNQAEAVLKQIREKLKTLNRNDIETLINAYLKEKEEIQVYLNNKRMEMLEEAKNKRARIPSFCLSEDLIKK